MEEKQIQDELASIRNLMERSSKFISLSGLSGILAGVYALLGAAVTYHINRENNFKIYPYCTIRPIGDAVSNGLYVRFTFPPLFVIALLVFVASVGTGIFLTTRKAKQKGQPIWGSTSRAVLFHLATPLITGGIFTLILISRGYYDVIAPSTLVFYGLSLVGASSFTFSMIKYLGICEIILGLIAACLPGYGLLFWAIGFGVLHIIYGSLMYFKYDR